ncbi:hypothetical protein L9F63_011702, partial [Diploptera punctata]
CSELSDGNLDLILGQIRVSVDDLRRRIMCAVLSRTTCFSHSNRDLCSYNRYIVRNPLQLPFLTTFFNNNRALNIVVN